MNGIAVRFRVVRGNGILSSPVAVSGVDGIARLDFWILGIRPGLNVLAATTGGKDTVVFQVIANAGPLASITKLDSDYDYDDVFEGFPLSGRRVSVNDRYGNWMQGVEVRFRVEAGGGSISEELARSDSNGVAQSAPWTMGSAGLQQLSAQAGSLPPVTFGAFALPRPFACLEANIVPQTTYTGELTSTSCRAPDGRVVAVYALHVPVAGLFSFTMSSDKFDTYLELRDGGVEAARNDNGTPRQSNSAFKAWLAPRTYLLVGTSSTGSAMGSFTLSVNQITDQVAFCEEIFIVRRTETLQVARSSDCTRPDGYSDRYLIYLLRGWQVDFTVQDRNYSFPNVELVSPNGISTVGKESGFNENMLRYAVPATGYYTLHVGLGLDEVQHYQLIVR